MTKFTSPRARHTNLGKDKSCLHQSFGHASRRLLGACEKTVDRQLIHLYYCRNVNQLERLDCLTELHQSIATSTSTRSSAYSTSHSVQLDHARSTLESRLQRVCLHTQLDDMAVPTIQFEDRIDRVRSRDDAFTTSNDLNDGIVSIYDAITIYSSRLTLTPGLLANSLYWPLGFPFAWPVS